MSNPQQHPHLVFVYGTLKKDHRNHHVLMRHTPHFVGPAITAAPAYRMIVQTSSSTVGRMTPGILKNTNGNGARIKGEIYAVNDAGFGALDELEQLGSLYHREKITCLLNDNLNDGETEVTAWIYIKIDDSDSHSLDGYVIQDDTAYGALEWIHRH